MIISHLCYECNFQGDLRASNNQVQCPNCKTINDVWLEGESEPKRHIEMIKINQIRRKRMSKLQEFKDQLAQLEIEVSEQQEFREDLLKRIHEEEIKELDKEKTLTLNEEGLRKLLCYLETTIITNEDVPSKSNGRKMLLDFREELSWDIADIIGIDLNEGNIDAQTLEYYTYSSRM